MIVHICCHISASTFINPLIAKVFTLLVVLLGIVIDICLYNSKRFFYEPPSPTCKSYNINSCISIHGNTKEHPWQYTFAAITQSVMKHNLWY